MSDYLNNLLARELGRLESVEPRRPSRFEPPAASATFPVAAGRFGDDATEPGELSRKGLTETSATETFADSHGPSPTGFSPGPRQHFDASSSTDEPRTPRSFEPEAGPHARPAPSSSEPRPSATLSPSGQMRTRPSGFNAEAESSSSSSPKLEPSLTPAHTPPTTKGGKTPGDTGRARASSNASPLSEDASPSPDERARSSQNPPSRFSPSGLEADEAGGAPPRPIAPPRETLLVPVLDAREITSRAALARESDARATQPAETRGPRPSEHTARAVEPKAASAAAEHTRKNAREERSEGSDGESLEGRRARRQASQVEPRVTRRDEAREAGRRRQQSADARAESESAPTVNVTIGRIEIRASAPAPRPRARREPSGGAPMSLEDYLRRRGGGGGGR